MGIDVWEFFIIMKKGKDPNWNKVKKIIFDINDNLTFKYFDNSEGYYEGLFASTLGLKQLNKNTKVGKLLKEKLLSYLNFIKNTYENPDLYKSVDKFEYDDKTFFVLFAMDNYEDDSRFMATKYFSDFLDLYYSAIGANYNYEHNINKPFTVFLHFNEKEPDTPAYKFMKKHDFWKVIGAIDPDEIKYIDDLF